ncbi:hypothetical protein GCM10010483_53810 [Actinokineospora diospyrosa]
MELSPNPVITRIRPRSNATDSGRNTNPTPAITSTTTAITTIRDGRRNNRGIHETTALATGELPRQTSRTNCANRFVATPAANIDTPVNANTTPENHESGHPTVATRIAEVPASTSAKITTIEITTTRARRLGLSPGSTTVRLPGSDRQERIVLAEVDHRAALAETRRPHTPNVITAGNQPLWPPTRRW